MAPFERVELDFPVRTLPERRAQDRKPTRLRVSFEVLDPKQAREAIAALEQRNLPTLLKPTPWPPANLAQGVDVSPGGLGVRGSLDQLDRRFMPGAFVDLRITVDPPNQAIHAVAKVAWMRWTSDGAGFRAGFSFVAIDRQDLLAVAASGKGDYD